MAFVWRATFIDEAAPEVVHAKRARSEPPARARPSDEFDAEREYVANLEKKAHELKAPKTPRKLQFSASRSRAGSNKSTKSTTSTTCSAQTPVSRSSTRYSTLCSDAGTPIWRDSCPPSPCSGPSDSPCESPCFGMSSPTQQLTLTERCIRFDAADAGPVPAGRVPNGTACRGSALEGGLPLPISAGCRRESAAFSETASIASVCPRARAPHLSKPHRDLLKRMPFSERVTLMLPMIRRHVARMHLAGDAKELLQALRSVANNQPPRTDARRTQLLSALGVLSVRALITAIVKAPDTPDWLKEGLLKDQLDRIRGMDTLVA